MHIVHRHLYNDFPTSSILHKNDSAKPVKSVKIKDQIVSPSFMLVYKRMKIGMKLSYESYMKNVRVGRLFNIAIYKTII